MRPGQIVRAAAGREAGRFFVVVDIAGERVKIADGKHRTLNKPKLKNPLHLKPTGSAVELSGLTDRRLRKELSEYREKSQEGGS